jgi:hypothetical protein
LQRVSADQTLRDECVETAQQRVKVDAVACEVTPLTIGRQGRTSRQTFRLINQLGLARIAALQQ